MASPQFVFGYGSLTDAADGFVATLPGWRRHWGVAMDNARSLPAYKFYVRPDGSRPALPVCFLDIDLVADGGSAPARPGAGVTGLCRPVGAAELRRLDLRERNYDRVRVDGVRGAPSGAIVWTYRGSAAGRARLRASAAAGTAVIAREYLERVHRGFAGLGTAVHDGARPSLDPGAIPVVELARRDLA